MTILELAGDMVDIREAGRAREEMRATGQVPVDPCMYLISSADGPVTGDDDIDIAGHALEQSQRGEVVPDRVSGVVQVEHRDQDVGKHVAGDENPVFLDQQRHMTRGMRLVLDDPDSGAIPRNLGHLGGQAGNVAEEVQR